MVNTKALIYIVSLILVVICAVVVIDISISSEKVEELKPSAAGTAADVMTHYHEELKEGESSYDASYLNSVLQRITK